MPSPFTLLAYETTSALQLACARKYAAHRFPVLPPPLHGGVRRHHDKVRVAYLSADFNRHATSYLMANLFERHDRSRFEVYAISLGPDDRSGMRQRLRRAFAVAGDQLIMRAFAGQQRPRTADARAVKRPSVGVLAIAVAVVAVPRRP